MLATLSSARHATSALVGSQDSRRYSAMQGMTRQLELLEKAQVEDSVTKLRSANVTLTLGDFGTTEGLLNDDVTT